MMGVFAPLLFPPPCDDAALRAQRCLPLCATKTSAAPPEEPPDVFLCAITHELMVDPVLATDGHTYEREAIETWLTKRLASPKTGEALSSAVVFPNHAMHTQILEWKEAVGA